MGKRLMPVRRNGTGDVVLSSQPGLLRSEEAVVDAGHFRVKELHIFQLIESEH